MNAVQACAAAAAAAAAPIAVESRSPSCDADDQALAVREEGLSCSSVAHAEEVSRAHALPWQCGYAMEPSAGFLYSVIHSVLQHIPPIHLAALLWPSRAPWPQASAVQDWLASPVYSSVGLGHPLKKGTATAPPAIA